MKMRNWLFNLQLSLFLIFIAEGTEGIDNDLDIQKGFSRDILKEAAWVLKNQAFLFLFYEDFNLLL